MGINRKLQRNLKQNQKKMEKKQVQQDKKYANQAYRPDTEVKLTGEEFMILQRIAQDLLQNRIIMVNVKVGDVIHKGQGLSPNDFDIQGLSQYVEKLHYANVDAGITTPIDVLRKEFEEESKKEKEQKPVLTVEPLKEEKVEQEEVVVETEQVEESAPKKINFKDKE